MRCIVLFLALCGAAPALAGDDGIAARGQQLLEEREFEAAAELLERAVADAPSDLDLHFLLGLARFGAGQLEAAEAPFLAVAAARPNDPLPHEFLGRLYFRLDRLVEAANSLERAAATGPQDGRTQNHLGIVLMHMQRYEESLEAFRRAIELDPSYAVGHYNVGVLCVVLGDPLGGRLHLEEAARLDPSDADPPAALAELHRKRGDTEAALSWFEESVRREPFRSELWLEVGLTARELGRTIEAEDALRTACDLPFASADPYLALGQMLAGCGRVDEANASLAEAAARAGDDVVAHLTIAGIAEDMGADELTRRHLQAAVGLGASDPSDLRRLSETCEGLGDADGARTAFELLVLTNEGKRASMLAIADRMASSNVNGIRDVEQGYALARALADGGRTATALFILSRAAAAMGQPAEEAAHLEEAAGLCEPGEPTSTLLLRRAQAAREVASRR